LERIKPLVIEEIRKVKEEETRKRREAEEARQRREAEERKARERREAEEKKRLKKEKAKLTFGWFLQICLCAAYLFVLYGTDIVRSPWMADEFTFMRYIPLIIFSLAFGMVYLIFKGYSDYTFTFEITILIIMILVQSITICVWRGDVGILLVYLISRIAINTLCAIPCMLICVQLEDVREICSVFLQFCLCIAYLSILYGTDIIRDPWEADGFTFMRCLPFVIFSLAYGIINLIFMRTEYDTSSSISWTLLMVMILIQSITICVWKENVGILFIYLIGRIVINFICATPYMILMGMIAGKRNN